MEREQEFRGGSRDIDRDLEETANMKVAQYLQS